MKNGVELNNFPLAGSGVPYGYTPVLLAHPRFCEAGSADAEILKKFLDVSSRGYRHAAQHPAEAAEALFEASKRHPTLVALGNDFLLESARYLATGGHYLDESGAWGKMDPARWEQFVEWLFANNCITARDGSVLPRYAQLYERTYSNTVRTRPRTITITSADFLFLFIPLRFIITLYPIQIIDQCCRPFHERVSSLTV